MHSNYVHCVCSHHMATAHIRISTWFVDLPHVQLQLWKGDTNCNKLICHETYIEQVSILSPKLSYKMISASLEKLHSPTGWPPPYSKVQTVASAELKTENEGGTSPRSHRRTENRGRGITMRHKVAPSHDFHSGLPVPFLTAVPPPTWLMAIQFPWSPALHFWLPK